MILLISVRLLDDRYHGLTANGEKPEWPPSPFRLFQAIVAGNAHGIRLPAEVTDALKWLEALSAPEVIAPRGGNGQTVLTYVLNNTDGRSRTPKVIRPTVLDGDRLIQYAWKFDPSSKDAVRHADIVAKASRHIRALGWGIDMAIGNGEIVDTYPSAAHSRIRFLPTIDDRGGTDIRSPRVGSLASLEECYSQYLARFESNESTQLESGGPIYRLQSYVAGQSRPHAVFKLLDPNEDPAQYPHAKLIHIAGMVRHLAINTMADAGADKKLVDRFIRGKRDPAAGEEHKQISYVPLPSIGHEHADGIIRNVMLIAPFGMEHKLAELGRRIDGQSLTPEGEFEDCKSDSSPTNTYRAELRLFTPPANKFIAERYLGTSKVWHSVTPVILDGHNKKSKTDKPEAIARETVKLIRKALQRADIETPCEFTWQSVPFLKNCLSAHKYDRDGRHTGYHRPSHLKDLTAIHVRLNFEYPVPGPITLGAGRHCGLGLLAAIE